MQTIEMETYDFPTMRRKNRIYVDKTGQFHQLITGNTSLHFVARPRRFGKSLMISTLDCIFHGRKELFEGLAISKTDYDWPIHPVIRFDFSAVESTSLEAFNRSFRLNVLDALRAAGATTFPEEQPGDNFSRAIQELYEKNGREVVVLVDEYDAPIGHALHKPELATAIREAMSALYIHLKRNVNLLRFLMMTGVSKFSQTSTFSALNNITDLTLDARAATLLGYTDDELEFYFHDAMVAHAQLMGLDYEAYREQLRFWYNGYHFSPDCLGPQFAVYNPFAIARTLGNPSRDFKATWSSTGRPSILMNYLSREQLVKQDYENLSGVTEDLMAATNLDNLSGIALLFQSGYLTIKDYRRGSYTLGIPDEEVRRDLLTILVQTIAQRPASDPWFSQTLNALITHNFPEFFANLKVLYSDLPYGSTEQENVPESAYLRLLYLLLRSRFSNLEVCFERPQAGTRPDLVFVDEEAIFIFELKVNRDGKRDAASALAQIHERGYAEPFRSHGLPLYAIGLAFDPKTHRLIDAASEAL
ncbi:MAG: AAA family ATPase [Candidatus Spyradenecus sp.]